jgi:mannose-1-phosphate guanylyltransferase
VALAAHYVAKHFGPDALLLILPADHWIEENLAFELSVKKAIHLAQAPYHQLVTFGIVPDSAQTGFGYIHAGEPLEDGYRVNAFVEKPDLPTAQAYLNSGNYYWNSGIFCFSAGVLLQELATHAPDLAARTADCLRESKFLDAAHSSILSIDQRNFEPIPDISIDYALMEKSKRVAVVPASFAWSDIGSWSTIRNLVKPDTNHNRTLGEVIYFNASHNFVQSEHRVVTLVGAHDLIVIDTEDALLIANSENAQEVKSVVAQLKEQNHETVKSHRTTNRPWGTYTVLDEYPGYKVKRIMVNPGASLSLQIHHHRAEHWVVVRGSAQVTNGEEVMTLTPNQSTFIPAGQKHRLANLGPEPLEIIEVQSGTYLDEDDIVRFDDLYQRT